MSTKLAAYLALGMAMAPRGEREPRYAKPIGKANKTKKAARKRARQSRRRNRNR